MFICYCNFKIRKVFYLGRKSYFNFILLNLIFWWHLLLLFFFFLFFVQRNVWRPKNVFLRSFLSLSFLLCRILETGFPFFLYDKSRKCVETVHPLLEEIQNIKTHPFCILHLQVIFFILDPVNYLKNFMTTSILRIKFNKGLIGWTKINQFY